MAELDTVFGGQDNGLTGASMQNRLSNNLRNDNNQYNNRNDNVYGNNPTYNNAQPQIDSVNVNSDTNPENDAAIEKIQKQIIKQKKINELKKELKSNDSIIDKYIKRKKDMIKLFSLSLLILLALSINDIIKVYVNKYILSNEMTGNKELYTRIGVPLCVYLVMWTLKALY
tara:strand:+ start:69 stop:581 length:513 start_codon:yes stop_codon:yes gene_type:complete